MINTLTSLIHHAQTPDRISVGIVLQVHSVEDLWSKDLDKFRDRLGDLRILELDCQQAEGPMKARTLCQQRLYAGEEYFLQIDAHMRFSPAWDKVLIDMLNSCPESSKAILSTYPPDLPTQYLSCDSRCFVLCADRFDESGFLRIKSKRVQNPPQSAFLSLFWAAGFSFSKGSICCNAPYVDWFPMLFFGEETIMSYRLWNAGYKFFCPNRTVIYHSWSRSTRSVFTENLKMDERALIRLRSQRDALKLIRSLQNEEKQTTSYSHFCGVDFVEQVIQEFSKSGGLPSNQLFQDPLEKVFSLLQQNGMIQT